MLLNPRYGRPGLIGFPYQVMVELLGPVIELVGMASILASAFVGLLSREAMLYLLLFGYLAGTIISVAAVLLEELTYRRYASIRDLLRLLAYTFLDFFPYRQFLIVCRIWGLVDYFRRPHSWGAQRRKGFAPQTVER